MLVRRTQEAQAEPRPIPANPPRSGGEAWAGRKLPEWTAGLPLPPEDLRKRVETAYALVVAGLSNRRASELTAKECQCTYEAAYSAVRMIHSRLKADFEGEGTTIAEKPIQIERIRGDLGKMRAEKNPKWQAIAKHEELIGRLLGTFAPVRFAIDTTIEVRQSLVAIVTNMTPEEQEQMVAEQLALEARAGYPAAAAE